MFGSYDRMTLSLTNAADIDGNLLPFSAKLPLERDLAIPSELASIDVFEYQEGFISGGEIVFSIYVGKKDTIEKMIDMNDGIGMQLRDEIEIPFVDSPICYQIVNGKKRIYTLVADNDIVVEGHDELRSVISALSSNYKEFLDAAQKIKTFNLNKE